MNKPNTLGLDDDLDSVELLSAVEQAFNVSFTDDDVAQMRTLGDLHTAILRKLPMEAGQKCRSQMAFYRLRRVLKVLAPATEIRANTEIGVVANKSPRTLMNLVEADSGMHSAPLELSSVGVFGLACFFLCLFTFPILAVANSLNWGAISVLTACMAVAVFLVRTDRGRFRQQDQTVGDIAKSIAARNYGKLTGAGAKHSSALSWEALTEITSAYSELPTNEIRLDTVLLQSQFNAQISRQRTG